MRELKEILSQFIRLNINRKNELPIRSSEMGVLIFIEQNPKSKSIEIAKYFDFSKPNVAEIIKKLIEKGYIVKQIDEKDKRNFELTITTTGREITKIAKEKFINQIDLFKEKMSNNDFIEFMRLMKIANEILKEEK